MKKNILFHIKTAGLVLFLVFSLQHLYAKSIGITVSGGDNRSHVDEWREKNAKEACSKFGELGIKECHVTFHKDSVKKYIQKAVKELKCGDTLALFFNGHGDKKKGFCFDKERHGSDEEFLSPDELNDWLKDLECCVKIYAGVHCCYSGDFIDKLRDNKHFVVLVSSSGTGDKSHKKSGWDNVRGGWVSKLNWPDGFVGGLKKGGSLADAFQRAAARGKEQAEKKDSDKDKKYKDSPRDYKKGHIEKVEKVPGGLKVTLKVGDGLVTIILPKKGKTNITDLDISELTKCFDVEIGGVAVFSKDTLFKPRRTHIKTPLVKVYGFKGKFHVIEVDKAKKKARVCFYDPPGLRGKTRFIPLDPWPADIEFCKWYSTYAKIYKKSLIKGTETKPATPGLWKFEAHIIKVSPDGDEVEVEIRKPEYLKGKKRKLKLKPGKKFPKWMSVCVVMNFNGYITKDFIECEGEFVVKTEYFKAHVLDVDRTNGIITIDKIQTPERLKGETKKIKMDPEKIPDIETCMTIVFWGDHYGDVIKDVYNMNKKHN